MKKLLSLLLACTLVAMPAFAQKPKSTVRFRLSDGAPLLITINGRDFQKTGRSITISDLPGKRQRVDIYRFRPYADGKGGKAERVFSGTLKIERGKTYEAMVDVEKGKLRLQQVVSIAPDQLPFDPKRDEAIAAPAGSELTALMDPALKALKQSMEEQPEDSKKLYQAKKFIANNSYSTQDLRQICSWLLFDDTRMVLVKAAYAQVKDPENYSRLLSVFTLKENQEAFLQFMQTKK